MTKGIKYYCVKLQLYFSEKKVYLETVYWLLIYIFKVAQLLALVVSKSLTPWYMFLNEKYECDPRNIIYIHIQYAPTCE